MKKILFYALALTLTLGVVSCQEAKLKTVVKELNKEFPFSTGSGVALIKAEALPDNAIKIHGEITDPIFDELDSVALANLNVVMKNAMIVQVAQSNAIRDVGANLIYEFTTASGNIFSVEISAEEIRNVDYNALINTAVNNDKMTVLHNMINSTKPTLPIVIDEENEMKIIDVYIKSESTLVYVYEIPRENIASTNADELKLGIIELLCANQSVQSLLEKGINLLYIYKTPENEELAQVTLDFNDFSANCF